MDTFRTPKDFDDANIPTPDGTGAAVLLGAQLRGQRANNVAVISAYDASNNNHGAVHIASVIGNAPSEAYTNNGLEDLSS